MKRTFTFLSSLFLAIGAMWAQSEATRMTADQLNAVTEKQPIVIECTQVSYYGRFYDHVNGDEYSLVNAGGDLAAITYYWVPAEEGVAGTYYIMKGDGENDYLQSNNITTYGTKESAAKFHAVKPYNGGAGAENFGGADCHYNQTDAERAAWVRLAFLDNSMWFNFNGKQYNSGTGVWTVFYVHDMSAMVEPEPEPEPGTWAPSEVGNGTFYLYNVGADMFMCSGNAWGSLASVAVGGVPMTLAVSDEAYTISSAAIYKDMFLGLDNQQNPFMDCGATNWTFEEVAENVYKIKIDEKVLFWSGEGTTTLGYGDDPNTEASQWMLYTEEARIAKMAEATADAPMDVTFLIKNAYFAKGNGRIVAKDADLTNSPSWKGTSLTDLWGHDTWESSANYAAEQYGKQFDNYQELKNIPNGVYHMTAKGFYRGSVVPYIYANDEKCELKVKGDIGGDNIGNAAKAMIGNDYLLEGVKVTVEDGTLRVGVKSDESMEWCVFDDFQLTYYGAPEWATEEQKQALSEAIAEAEGHILGFAAGEYAPYTNVEALKALAAAKAVDADNALAGEITAVLETLAAAVWTENAEEMNAIYDGSFAADYSGLTGNVKPTGWNRTSGTNTGYEVRYMTVPEGATTTGHGMMIKFAANYGKDAGYTMPLKANSVYDLSFMYAGWGNTPTVNILIKDEAGNAVSIEPASFKAESNQGDKDATVWQKYEGKFTTGEKDANYVLYFDKSETQQEQVGFGDFKLSYAGAAVVEVASVTLDKTEATLTEAGATVTLVATVAPENATDKTVTWSTSDDKVATVVDGVVTAVANGKATITAKAGEFSATCEVTVAIPVVEEPFTTEIVGVTPAEGEVTELSEIIVQFSNDKVLPYSNVFLVDAAENSYEFVLDVDHSDYTQARYVAKGGAITAAGTYVLDCSQIDHMDMMTGKTINPFEGTFTWVIKAAEVGFGTEIVGVTPAEGEVTELSEIIVQFSNDKVLPYSNVFLTDEAENSYEFVLDVDHSDYTQARYVAKDGAITAAGTYTLDCSQIDHMDMMTGKTINPFEGTFTWTIKAVVDGIQNINADADAVIYDIHGRRVEKMTKGLYIVNGKKVLVK